MARQQEDLYGFKSPGGFVFGVTGWNWGDQIPRSITFFLDNTCKISDQWGRPIKGGEKDGKIILFAPAPPTQDDLPGSRSKYATHKEVVDYLMSDLHLDWRKLVWAGFPQLPYEELKKTNGLLWPFDDSHRTDGKCSCAHCCIKETSVRKDALRLRREISDNRLKEERAVAEAMAEE